ncbi:MAG TPA: hypothetical protein VK759_08130, partial [Rhizomicrobium sp.]|nr:hypothetical protein [Rhizomicrobium sp.]
PKSDDGSVAPLQPSVHGVLSKKLLSAKDSPQSLALAPTHYTTTQLRRRFGVLNFLSRNRSSKEKP